MPRTRSLAWSELKLGIVGIAAATLVVVIIFAIGGQAGFFWQRYPLKARFTTIQGLKAGAVVRLNGQEIGRVTSIEFVGAQIDVGLQVQKSVRPLVTTDSTAVIGSLSLLGEPIIDLTAASTGTPLPDWAYVRTGPAGGILGMLSSTASEGLSGVNAIVGDIRSGRGTLGRLVTDDAVYNQLHEFLTAATRVTQALENGKGTLGQLANDPAAYHSLKGSLDNLQAITDELRSGRGSLGKLLNDDTTVTSLNATLADLRQVTERLSKGQGTLGKLATDEELYDRLNSAVNRLDHITADLDAGRGTAGKLLHDEQLYQSLDKAVSDLRALISDVRKDPKKYLNMSFHIF